MPHRHTSADLRDYLSADGELDVRHDEMPRVRFLTRLVESGTSRPPGEPRYTALQCRRRPSARPCVGVITLLCSEVPRQIEWECQICHDGGRLVGWHRTEWDLAPAEREPPDDRVCATLERPEYNVLLDEVPRTRALRRVVADAESISPDAVARPRRLTPLLAAYPILIVGRAAEIESLSGAVREASEGAPPARVRALRALEAQLAKAHPLTG
jgi:hypothetical protein